jgi:hypothetical protein
MSLFHQYKVIENMIFAECARLSFDQTMLNDLSIIMFQRQQRRLTLRQAKSLLVELQRIDDSIEPHPDSPIARWQAREQKRKI